MKKLLNKKGFTLMEMLIVVAIIVILVAVSVPTFTSSLDDAKKATDAANLRAAKSLANIAYVMNQWPAAPADVTDVKYYYDIESGKIVAKAAYPTTGYGECSKHGSSAYIKVNKEDGTVEWADSADSADTYKTSCGE